MRLARSGLDVRRQQSVDAGMATHRIPISIPPIRSTPAVNRIRGNVRSWVGLATDRACIVQRFIRAVAEAAAGRLSWRTLRAADDANGWGVWSREDENATPRRWRVTILEEDV